jgi:hypothetical protein
MSVAPKIMRGGGDRPVSIMKSNRLFPLQNAGLVRHHAGLVERRLSIKD